MTTHTTLDICSFWFAGSVAESAANRRFTMTTCSTICAALRSFLLARGSKDQCRKHLTDLSCPVIAGPGLDTLQSRPWKAVEQVRRESCTVEEEAALQAHAPGVAELAVHGAADLGGHTHSDACLLPLLAHYGNDYLQVQPRCVSAEDNQAGFRQT